ncbi:MAG: RagB/SusD family nutrient uptake outer membrane protein [Cyclobacteriaceae bacterium]|nr:RagB/SusD family nutrient uptake outer membrane protein [Cyclobacteriaceae bacterium]
MVAFLLVTGACMDLDIEPFEEGELLSEVVFQDFENYEAVLAKLYAGLALTGQQGPAGNGDIAGVDEGASNYLRTYFYMQDLPTDVAHLSWGDEGVPDMRNMTWSSNNIFVTAMYYRLFFQIALANEIMREMSTDRMNSRGISAANQETALRFREEARLLRSLSYYHALDLFSEVPFVTEDDPIGAFNPEPISRPDLFEFLERELVEMLDGDLLFAEGQAPYARADKGAARMILGKLYLNAEVYTGSPRYSDAVQVLLPLLDNYSLDPNWERLFMADNDQAQGIILPVALDGVRSQSFGASTFLNNAPVGDIMKAEEFGTSGGWAGLRPRRQFFELFNGTEFRMDSTLEELASAPADRDLRGRFFQGEAFTEEMTTASEFTNGLPYVKFRNIRFDSGAPGSNAAQGQSDVDFPLFRLADAMLMIAEASLRGGGGADAVDLVNQVRIRAGAAPLASVTLDDILDERAKELAWECHRRTDLIRFGLFTSSTYLWEWKGGVLGGTGVSDALNIYPIPAQDLAANPNLRPTPGY